MATTTAHKKTGVKIGAASAAVVLFLAGIGGCNYLQDQDETSSTQSLGQESNQPAPSDNDEPNNPDSSQGPDEDLDPAPEDRDEDRTNPGGGNSTERIIVNPDGTTSVVQAEEQASESDSGDGSEGINPGDIDAPEDRPADEGAASEERNQSPRNEGAGTDSNEAPANPGIPSDSPDTDDVSGGGDDAPSNDDGETSSDGESPSNDEAPSGNDGNSSDDNDAAPSNPGSDEQGTSNDGENSDTPEGGEADPSPGNPDTPNEPGNPGNPGGSDTPDEPSDPDPEEPGNPGNPSDPDPEEPGNPNPGNPDPGNPDPDNPDEPGNPGNPDDPTPGDPTPEEPGDQDVNVQELIDYINTQRNLDDANNDGGIWNDEVPTDSAAPDADLYEKNGGALVVVNDDGRPVGVIWSDMSQQERDSLLRDLSQQDETRIYGVNRNDDKAEISIDQYILRDTEARDDTVEVEEGGSVTINAEDLLENDRVLQDEGNLFGQNKGASNITDVKSEFEGIVWNPSTGEVRVDPENYTGDADEITFTYTIRHDQDEARNKSRNTSSSTGTVTVKINRVNEQENPAQDPETQAPEENTDGTGTDEVLIPDLVDEPSSEDTTSATVEDDPKVITPASGGDEITGPAEEDAPAPAAATDEATSTTEDSGTESRVGRHVAVNEDGSKAYATDAPSSTSAPRHRAEVTEETVPEVPVVPEAPVAAPAEPAPVEPEVVEEEAAPTSAEGSAIETAAAPPATVETPQAEAPVTQASSAPEAVVTAPKTSAATTGNTPASTEAAQTSAATTEVTQAPAQAGSSEVAETGSTSEG